MNDYELLDSGHHCKLERFGEHILIRPSIQAQWDPVLEKSFWQKESAIFTREEKGTWITRKTLPPQWVVNHEGISFLISMTDFGHVGLFPEHALFYSFLKEKIQNKPLSLLNLFAYTGGASMAGAKAGASVTHVDASKPTVLWAQQNAKLNNLQQHPIRYITDDALSFIKREARRGKKYHGIILDPPSFGRGPNGELFKIERDILPILHGVKAILEEENAFILFSCHTPGFTGVTLAQLLQQVFGKGKIQSGEMLLHAKKSFSLPSGFYAIWEQT